MAPCTMCLRNLRQGRCLVLLFGYILGIILGCAITLTFDFRYAEPVSGGNVKRELLSLATDEIIETNNHAHNNNHRSDSPSHLSPAPTVHYTSPLENHFLFVAVLPKDDIRQSIDSIVHTWGQTVSNLTVFISKDTKVPSFHDPEQKSSIVTMFERPLDTQPTTSQFFQVVSHLYKNHRTHYKWFLIGNERMYVNVYMLHEITDSAGPRDILYTGYMGGEETIPTTYCLGDAGVLLSQETLVRLGLKLEECSKRKRMSSLPWDAGLGNCMNISLGLGCFKLFSEHFVVDKLRTSRSPDELLKPNSPFSKALTIYPVVSSEHMYTLHYFFSSTELKKAIERVNFFNNLVETSCQELPQALLENEVVQSDCSAVGPDEKEDESETTSKAVIKQHVPFRRFKPADKFQYQHWKYFDPYYIYTDDTIDPYVPVKAYKYHSLELKRAIQEAVSVVSKRHHPSRMKFKRLHNGYVRHNPLQGNEYIIDATFVQRRKPRKSFNERVRILRPLSSGFILQSAKNDLQEKVHIVVPISDVTKRCFDFLSMFANVSFTTKESTHLVLVIYGEKDLKEIEEKIEYYHKTFPEAEISIVKGIGSFSRAKALDLGMKSLEKNDLAFFCDVDMTMERDFLNRCRRNTIEGKMVYYPEVFKLYNPKFTGLNQNRKISRKQGHWVNYGYGMLCIYKSDYDSVGGLNTKMLGWGGEDVDLYEKVLKSKLEVLQSPDTGLIHRWHQNVCSESSTTKSNRESCVNSRAEVLGDKSELAKYIYELSEKHPELVTT